MEPIRDHDPQSGFLERVREIASGIGSVLIFDEITAGFRLNTGGAHLLYGVAPDIAVFAKGMSNGYPMAAIIGISEVMQAAQGTFISSTFWTERIGPTAALATIRKHQHYNVHEHLIRIGKLVQKGWKDLAGRVGLQVEVGGIYPLSHFSFQVPNAQAAHTLFTQLMLERGFLATKGFYASYAHQEEHVEKYMAAAEEAFNMINHTLKKADIGDMLNGPVAHQGFQRLT
jgi:glutamate-1-semialdehyde 2,1-aminomutase